MKTPIVDLFWKKIKKTPKCWTWETATSNGYGSFTSGKKLGYGTLPHRIAWTLLKGPIPAGLTIDHLCRIKTCVNPAHLDPVTMKINTLRGISPIARQAKQTYCIHGHPLFGNNLKLVSRRNRIWRRCVTCSRLNSNDRYYKNKIGGKNGNTRIKHGGCKQNHNAKNQ